MSDLANCVRFGLTLSKVMTSIASKAKVATVANGSIARDTAITIVDTSNDAIAIAVSNLADGVRLGLSLGVTLAKMMAPIASIADVAGVAYIVWMTGGVSVGDGETMSDLANCVWFGLSLGLTLPKVVTSIASEAEVSTVANGSIARYEAVAIVDTSDDAIAIAVGDLTDGVRLGLSFGLSLDSGNSQKKDGSGSHGAGC